MTDNTKSAANTKNLPVEVKNLLLDRLSIEQLEQQEQDFSDIQSAYSTMRDEILSRLTKKMSSQAMVSVFMAAYKSVVSVAANTTKTWPNSVWSTVASLLEKAKVEVIGSKELSKIVDLVSWPEDQEPFTLDYINPNRFKELVLREFGRFGLNDEDVIRRLEKRLNRVCASAACGIKNSARRARHRVDVQIKEYLLIKKSHVKEANSMQSDATRQGGKTAEHELNVFRQMNDLKFREITFKLNDETGGIQIVARGKSVSSSLHTLGMTRKNGVTLKKPGDVFCQLFRGAFRENETGNKRAITEISKLLRDALQTNDMPFKKCKPTFKLTIPADSTAQRNALRRQTSFDESKHCGVNDLTSEFLKTHDPHYDPSDPQYSDDPDLGAGD